MLLLGMAAVVLKSNQVLGQEEDQDADDSEVDTALAGNKRS